MEKCLPLENCQESNENVKSTTSSICKIYYCLSLLFFISSVYGGDNTERLPASDNDPSAWVVRLAHSNHIHELVNSFPNLSYSTFEKALTS